MILQNMMAAMVSDKSARMRVGLALHQYRTASMMLLAAKQNGSDPAVAIERFERAVRLVEDRLKALPTAAKPKSDSTP